MQSMVNVGFAKTGLWMAYGTAAYLIISLIAVFSMATMIDWLKNDARTMSYIMKVGFMFGIVFGLTSFLNYFYFLFDIIFPVVIAVSSIISFMIAAFVFVKVYGMKLRRKS